MKPQVAAPSRTNAESCPACGCHLDLLTDAGCPYCGWHDETPAMNVVGPGAGLFAARARSPWTIWGERLLTGGTFAIVAFAAFSLFVTLFRLIAGAFRR